MRGGRGSRGNNKVSSFNNFSNNQEQQERRRDQKNNFVESHLQQNSGQFLNPQPTPKITAQAPKLPQRTQVQKPQVQQKVQRDNTKPTQPQAQTPRQRQRGSQLPTLDDIDNYVSNQRQMDYDQHYATTGPVSNPIKDKLKRSKLRNKKAKGLLGTVNNNSGNSVLDSYRNLGKRLLK